MGRSSIHVSPLFSKFFKQIYGLLEKTVVTQDIIPKRIYLRIVLMEAKSLNFINVIIKVFENC